MKTWNSLIFLIAAFIMGGILLLGPAAECATRFRNGL